MNDYVQFLPIVALLIVFWFLVLRPAQRRQRDFQNLQADLAIGQRVMTTSGLFGQVRSLNDETIGLEIAPSTVVTFARAAVATIDKGDSVLGPDDL